MGMEWDRVNIKENCNSDVDVAVAADAVSVFHSKQPHFDSNDSLALGWRRKTRKRGRGRIHVRHFQDKLP